MAGFWRANFALLAFVAVAIGIAAPQIASCAVQDAQRPVKLQDAIESRSWGLPALGKGIVYSPDGRKAAFHLEHGDVKSGATIGELFIAEIDNESRPIIRRIFTAESTTNVLPIAQTRWLDETTLALVAAQGANPAQVVVLNEDGGKARVVSHAATNVLEFDISEDRTKILQIVEAKPITADYDDQVGGVVVERQTVSELASNGKYGGFLIRRKLILESPAGSLEQLFDPSEVPSEYIRPSLSPDGSRAIVAIVQLVNETDESKLAVLDRPPSGITLAYRYVDFKSLPIDPTGSLIAPAIFKVRTKAVWSQDGRSALLPQLFAKGKKGIPAVAQIDLETFSTKLIFSGAHCASSNRVGQLEFAPRRGERCVGSESEAAEYIGTRWVSAPAKRDLKKPKLDVRVEQTAARPMRIIAAFGRRRAVLEVNPGLAQRIGKVETIAVVSQASSHVVGIFLPKGYVPGHRYPTVIQVTPFHSDIFEIGGYGQASEGAGGLARVLNDEGFIVVSAGNLTGSGAAERDKNVAYLSDVAKTLIAKGYAEPDQIAIVGHSRNGWNALSTAVFGGVPFAAVVAIDASDDGFFSYVSTLGSRFEFLSRLTQLRNGGAGVHPNMDQWLKTSTSFNLYRLKSPTLLLSFGDVQAVENTYETYRILQLTGVPVENIWYPDAEHAPVKVTERIAIGSVVVDWLKYWTLGRSSGSSENFGRWARKFPAP